MSDIASFAIGKSVKPKIDTDQHIRISILHDRYGNALNVKRTVFGYARAGMGGIMIEDQVSPKRCGHVAGKSVVPFDEAVKRVQAACDAR